MSSAPDVPEIDYEQLETTYRGWVSDAAKSRDAAISAEKARMSKAGLKPGSTPWEKALQTVENQYQQVLQDLKASTTYNLIIENRQNQRKIRQSMTAPGVGDRETRYDRPATWERSGMGKAFFQTEGMGANFSTRRGKVADWFSELRSK